MNRKVLVSVLVVSVMAIAAVSGVMLYRSASAASAISSQSFGNQIGRGGPGRGPQDGATNEALASALGVTADELNAAYQKANTAALTEAVEKGLITQTQADELQSKGEAFPLGGRWMGQLQQQGIDYDALLADALGITPEQLKEAYAKAESARIDQAIADGKLTQEQADLMEAQRALRDSQRFQSSMQSAFETAVKQAVSEGVITQAQADLILQAASQGGARMGMPFMGDMGGGHGRGGPGEGPGFGMGNGGQPGNPPTTGNGS